MCFWTDHIGWPAAWFRKGCAWFFGCLTGANLRPETRKPLLHRNITDNLSTIIKCFAIATYRHSGNYKTWCDSGSLRGCQTNDQRNMGKSTQFKKNSSEWKRCVNYTGKYRPHLNLNSSLFKCVCIIWKPIKYTTTPSYIHAIIKFYSPTYILQCWQSEKENHHHRGYIIYIYSHVNVFKSKFLAYCVKNHLISDLGGNSATGKSVRSCLAEFIAFFSAARLFKIRKYETRLHQCEWGGASLAHRIY